MILDCEDESLLGNCEDAVTTRLGQCHLRSVDMYQTKLSTFRLLPMQRTQAAAAPTQHRALELPPECGLATWIKYIILARHCEHLSIASKREIFSIMRDEVAKSTPQTHSQLYHMYLPRIGLSLGECSLFHTISEHLRRSNSKNGKTR